MSHYFAQFGPLGMANMRNNKGRGAIIGDPAVPRAKRREVVLQAGAQGAPADRNAGDALASFLTVALGYADVNDQNVQTPVTLQAEILWGTDGYQQRALVDWRNGQMVRVTGSFIRVTAHQVADGNTNVFPPGAAASVGATVGYGFSGTTPATLTETTLIDAESTFLARVPAHAYAVTIVAFSLGGLHMLWLAQNGAAEVSSFPGTSITPASVVRRPNDGHYLQVNNDAMAPTRVSLVWLLDL